MTTGERMKNRRKDLGLSAETVAETLGVSPATIYRYENGYIDKVPGDKLDPIAKALKTTPSYLMGWGDQTEICDTPNQPDSETTEESDLRTKYRALDQHGKHLITSLLEMEYGRMLKEQEDEKGIQTLSNFPYTQDA